METNADYRIAIFNRAEDPAALSEVFQRILGIHSTDATIWSHHVPGILNENFSAEQAQSLVDALRALGLDVTAVRSNEIPDLHRALNVHHVRCEDGGLQLIDLHGNLQALIPWNDIQMICVGEAPLSSAHHYPPTNWRIVSVGHHYQHPDSITATQHDLQVWITCRSPHPHLHIDHEHMNYEYLGARRVESATINFSHFIQDVTTRATAALLPESTHAFLTHLQPEHYRFKSTEDLLHYSTLHSVLATHRSAANSAGTTNAPPCGQTP